MAIPVYRQNPDYDDWELASVYASDDCGSLGRSGSYESSYRSGSRDGPGFQMQGPFYGEGRPRVDYPVPQQQHPNHQNYPVVTVARSQWEVPTGKRNNFVPPPAPIVPPPGMIFPAKDWVLPPQDMYSQPPAEHVAPASDMAVDISLMELPPSTLLLPPPSPPHAASPQIQRPLPLKAIAHGQGPHVTAATGLSVHNHVSPITPPPPRYHDLVHTMSPRLADAGCQAPVMNPRRPGHDGLPPCGAEPSMARGAQANETRVEDGYYGYGPGNRVGSSHPAGPSKHEHERARPARRERRPSVWQRFVRRFSPARGVSAGNT